MEYGIKYRAVPDRMIPVGDPTLENVHNIVQLLRPKSRILEICFYVFFALKNTRFRKMVTCGSGLNLLFGNKQKTGLVFGN